MPNPTSFLPLLPALLLTLLLPTPTHSQRFPPDAYFAKSAAFMCVSSPRRVRAIFENHLTQLNSCNVTALKQERTPDTQLFFGPDRINGEAAVDSVFSNFCIPPQDGGLRGLHFREVHAFIVGNVISVKWIAEAPFLREPYPGSDAYVTCRGKMLTIVSSFDATELKFRE